MPNEKENRTISSDNTAEMHGIAAMTAALLLAVLSDFPGLFDSTLTSRLAVYPLCALIVLYTGRKQIPLWAAITAALFTVMPLAGMLQASIPVQGILPAVKWISFGLMIAGAAGIARYIGSRSIWISLTFASVIAAVIEILIRGDGIWGNTNRPGVLLAVGFVTAATGTGFKRIWIRIPSAVLTGIALILTNFILAWIAVILALLWFFLKPRRNLHPGIFIGILLAGQIVVTAAPDITRSIAPTLEIRCRIWQTGIGQLMRNLPLGTGTGQSRLTLIQDAGARVQVLAGDPEKRIDHLHSDILTPVVEWGLGGFLVICLAGWLIVRKQHFSSIDGAVLLCIFPFLSADLPLATPLGALPVALCIGVILGRRSGDRTIRIPLTALLVPVAGAVFWSVIIIRGYSLLERGRSFGISGIGSAGSAASTLERASSFIPFEERVWLYLSQAYLDDGMILAAGNTVGKFNSIYPAYWKGWMLQALTETASGRNRDAAGSYMNALRVAPVTLRERGTLALNAAAFPPEDVESLVMIGEAACEFEYSPAQETAEMAVTRAMRLVSVAEVLPDSERAIAGRMLLIAWNTLLRVQDSGEVNASVLDAALLRIRDRTRVIDYDQLNNNLQFPPVE